MELDVETEAGTVVLRDPSELTRCSVVTPDPGAPARSAAGGGTGGEVWDGGFTAMVADAASRGWIADDGAIRAHIDWRG